MDHDDYVQKSHEPVFDEPESEIDTEEIQDNQQVNDENLIKNVKIFPVLYNNRKKEPDKILNSWTKTAKNLNHSADICKKKMDKTTAVLLKGACKKANWKQFI